MMFIVNVLQAIGSGLIWLFQKFFPALAKKFGFAFIFYSSQFAISTILASIVLLWWGFVVYIVLEIYNRFNDFLVYLNSHASSGGGSGGQYLSCFFDLLTVSGIASGFNSAFAFTVIIILAIFTNMVYKSFILTVKTISDELSKLINAVK